MEAARSVGVPDTRKAEVVQPYYDAPRVGLLCLVAAKRRADTEIAVRDVCQEADLRETGAEADSRGWTLCAAPLCLACPVWLPGGFMLHSKGVGDVNCVAA